MVAAGSGLLHARGGTLRRRLGRSDVARLDAVTALYRSLDYEFGGGVLLEDVTRLAESATALLDQSYANSLAPSLFASVAATRQLAGWIAFDAGRHSDAQRHFASAERAACTAGDALLAARIRYCQARQYQHQRHNRDALDTIRVARDRLNMAATPAVTAMLHGAEAASLAALGERRAALASLGLARDAFDRVRPEAEPEWMGFYDEGELLAQYGRVYRDLARADSGEGAAAVRWVTEAISAFGTQNVRSSVLNEVGLCSAHFLADQPDEALTVGTRVVDRAAHLTSQRIFDRIANLRRDLARHAAMPEVARFARRLSTIAPATA
jgi:hypothetical protein